MTAASLLFIKDRFRGKKSKRIEAGYHVLGTGFGASLSNIVNCFQSKIISAYSSEIFLVTDLVLNESIIVMKYRPLCSPLKSS